MNYSLSFVQYSHWHSALTILLAAYWYFSKVFAVKFLINTRSESNNFDLLCFVFIGMGIFIGGRYEWAINSYRWRKPIPVAALYMAWVFGRSLAGITGWNPTGVMDVCRLWLLCVVWLSSLRRADHPSRAVLPSVVCLSVFVKARQ